MGAGYIDEVWDPTIQELVENNKSLYLVDLGPKRTDDLIVHMIDKFVSSNCGIRSEYSMSRDRGLAELIIYLELGFSYERHQELFDKALKILRMTREEVEEYVDKEYTTMHLSEKGIAKKLVWIKKGLGTRRAEKDRKEVAREIYALCKAAVAGSYQFSDAVSVHELVIDEDQGMRLCNRTKGYEFIITA